MAAIRTPVHYGSMLATVQQIREDVVKAAGAPMWPLPDDELISCLEEVHRCEQAQAVFKMRLASQIAAVGIPSAHGHRTTASWLRSRLRIDPQPARDLVKHAALLARWPVVEQALLDGRLEVRQAAAIASAVDQLPETLAEVDTTDACPAQIIEDAERTLIDMAGKFSAHELRRLGARILAHVAPEISDRVDELALQREEARAHAKRGLTFSSPIDGLVRLRGALSAEEAAIINAALQPLCKPHRGDDRSAEQRHADALVAVCNLAVRTGELPRHGGEPPQLSLTAAFNALTGSLGAGVMDSGERLSAGAVRRLACDARIVPVVLGGKSEVLDVGRASRTATGALRRALTVRDGDCAFPGCDRPPRWTDAHHIISWLAGGLTELDNLVLLCRHHHRLIHDPASDWQVRLGADRHPEFLPPAWLDPERRPQRNDMHPRA